MTKNSAPMSTKEAAAYLKLSEQYLRQCKHNGRGPIWTKVTVDGGGPGPRVRIVYDKADLDLWNSVRLAKKQKKPKVETQPKVSKPKKPRASRKTAPVAEAA